MFELLIGYQYRSAAVVSGEPPVSSGKLQLVDELRAQPGTRVPHVWIQAGGQRVSTLDLVGPGFTVLTGDERWRAAVSSASAALGIPLTMHCIGDAIAGLAPEGALLVRPDGIVGWRADELPADPEGELRQAVSAIVGREV